jgi:hypothetical protein
MRSLRGIGNRNNVFRKELFEKSAWCFGGGDVELCFAPPVRACSAAVGDGTCNPAHPLWRGLRTIQDHGEDIPSFFPLVHALAIVLLLVSGKFVTTHRHEIGRQLVGIVTEVSPYILPPSASKAGGGGGGGDRDKLQASKGILPRFLGNSWHLRQW